MAAQLQPHDRLVVGPDEVRPFPGRDAGPFGADPLRPFRRGGTRQRGLARLRQRRGLDPAATLRVPHQRGGFLTVFSAASTSAGLNTRPTRCAIARARSITMTVGVVSTSPTPMVISWKLSPDPTGAANNRSQTNLSMRPSAGAGCSGSSRKRIPDDQALLLPRPPAGTQPSGVPGLLAQPARTAGSRSCTGVGDPALCPVAQRLRAGDTRGRGGTRHCRRRWRSGVRWHRGALVRVDREPRRGVSDRGGTKTRGDPPYR